MTSNQFNEFYTVNGIVKDFKEARLWTSLGYREKVEKFIVFSLMGLCLALLISAFASMSDKLFIWFIITGIVTFTFTRFLYGFIPKFITKLIVKIIWGLTIDMKVDEIKYASRRELYLHKEVIQSMMRDYTWKQVAEDAIAIKEYRLN